MHAAPPPPPCTTPVLRRRCLLCAGGMRKQDIKNMLKDYCDEAVKLYVQVCVCGWGGGASSSS